MNTATAPEQNPEAEWQEVRRSGIGSSDAAGIVGLSPYSSPLNVWLEKTGRVTDDRETDAMHFGNVLEEVVLAEFARRQGVDVLGRDREGNPVIFLRNGGTDRPTQWDTGLLETLRHPDHPFIMVHLDGVADEGDRIALVEAKTTSAYRDDWGDDADDVPVEYIVQVHHQMLVLDALGHRVDRAWIPVLQGGNTFKVYYVDRRDDLLENLLKAEVAFWKRVEADEPPPASPNDGKALEALHPADDGELVEADEQTEGAARRLFRTKVQIDDLSAEKDALEAVLKERIGDNAGIEASDFKVTWKRTKDRTVTDWEAAFKDALGVAGLYAGDSEAEGEDWSGTLRALYDRLQRIPADHTTTKPGYRMFRTPNTSTMRELIGE